ncbi:hypothetical protein [Adhaeribacter rhizoryzae]|uniref:Lipocalin-like domain-containing protein n=1 Tax=Adhaeribacter rhizoryzae TaxID=2607907 RepID=A0A5M6DQC3_9BACT|nr:hypothetical protein [Adhaeribacter rhizoryzae]KAA5548429.1 hypothetical protein F0145_06800 [Adhaeribacter rhizoryzae]
MKKRLITFAAAGLAAFTFTTVLANSQLIATGLTPRTLPVLHALKLVAELEGRWEFVMTPPERDAITGVLSVKRGSGPAGYAGTILINELQQEKPTKITKAEVTGEKFVYAGEVILDSGTYTFEMSGTIKGNKLEGQTRVQEPDGVVIYKLEATRK